MNAKIILKAGEFGFAYMPHSEVCMHLRVAGRAVKFKLTLCKTAIQLLKENGENFSFPILLGEAGVYRDHETGELYFYPDGNRPKGGHSALFHWANYRGSYHEYCI